MEDPPYIKRNLKAAIDFVGFGLLAIWLATLQIVLDKGQEADWFGADWICWFAVISVAAFISFIMWEFSVEHPLVNLRILPSRNFATGVMLMTVVGTHSLRHDGGVAAVSANADGLSGAAKRLALSPRGVAAFVTTFFVGRLVGSIPLRGDAVHRLFPVEPVGLSC